MDANTVARCQQMLEEAQRSPGTYRAQGLVRAVRSIMAREHDGGASGLDCVLPHTVIQQDQVHPPATGDYIEPLMAPSRYLVVPQLSPAATVAPASDSVPVTLQFSSGGGWLIGWRGLAVSFANGAFSAGPVEQATLGVRMWINDGEELITNGLNADYAPFATIFGQSVSSTPIMRRVDVKDILNLQFRNFQPVDGVAMRPFITFSFWREKYPGAFG